MPADFDAVSLRQYIERLIEEREKLHTMRGESIATALKLQAEEYSRRLDVLNHAHLEAMENWATSLPRELFETWKSEHQRWKDQVNAELTAAQTRSATYTAVLGFLIIAIQLVLRFWKG